MVTLSSCPIWQIISFILPPNEYGSVYAWTTQGNIGTDRLTENADFGKKENHCFRWSSFWSWLVCIQAKLSHLKTRTHALKSRTSHCLVRIFFQRHNCSIFLRKWARRGRYNQWRSLSGHVERIFVHKNLRGGYWQHLVSTDRLISRRSVCPPRSCDLTPLDYYLCYADKSETIGALTDNIRETIDEIQLHAIDNVLKNCTDRVGYCMASWESHFNEIIFYY